MPSQNISFPQRLKVSRIKGKLKHYRAVSYENKYTLRVRTKSRTTNDVKS